jgi:integrase
MANRITTKADRNKLKQRREPYWRRLEHKSYLGYRKLKRGAGTWIARLTTSDGGYQYQRIGSEAEFDLDTAARQAKEWMSVARTVGTANQTVQDCIDDYIEHLELEKGGETAREIKLRLKKHVSKRLGSTEVRLLTTRQLKRWHAGMVDSSGDEESTRRRKDSANRVLSLLKAALNLAFRSDTAADDSAWRKVSPFKDVGASRRLFLTDKQISALLKATTGGFRNLVNAAVLTGARFGELANARVSDFNASSGTLHLNGKTGPRTCYLTDVAVQFFSEIARTRLPAANLLCRDDGEAWGKSQQHRPMKEAIKTAKIPAETVFYSLRHYHISKALLAGIPMQLIAENCGTSVRMI